jgi:small subunit ribosomal protein S2
MRKFMNSLKNKRQKSTLLNTETLQKIRDKQILKFFIKYKMHLGHHKKYIKKEFKSFLFCFFNDYGIIHLKKTLIQLRIAMHVLYHIGLQQQKILIVDAPFIRAKTIREEFFGSNNISSIEQLNWIPGLLSNNEVITKKLKNYLAEPNEGKDEDKEEDKRNVYQLILSSVENISAIVILDPLGSKDIMKEAAIVNIPIIALVDLNCSFLNVDYPIVMNNQNRGSVLMALKLLCSAFNKGLYAYWFYNKIARQKDVKLKQSFSKSSKNTFVLRNLNETSHFSEKKMNQKKGIVKKKHIKKDNETSSKKKNRKTK